jgi:WD40 repeat protein
MTRLLAPAAASLLLVALSGHAQPPQTQGNEPPMRTLQAQGGEGAFRAMAFSPDGKLLAAAEFMGDHLYLWDTATTQLTLTIQLPKKSHTHWLAFSADGTKVIIAGREDDQVRTFDVTTGKQLAAVDRPQVVFVALSGDGTLMATRPRGSHLPIAIHDVKTGKQLLEIKQPDSYGAAFAPDGKSLAIHTRLGEVGIWDLKTGKKIRGFHEGDPRKSAAHCFVAFAPDGKFLVTCGHIDKSLRVWEVATGKERTELTCKGFFAAATFGADNALVAHGGTDGAAVYDLVKGAEAWRLQPRDALEAVLFSRDGNLLALGGSKGAIYLYDFAKPGKK